MKVRFIRNTFPDEGGDYREGDVVELPEASYVRWLKRSAVVAVTEPEPVKHETTEPDDVPDGVASTVQTAALDISKEAKKVLIENGLVTVPDIQAHPDLTQFKGIGRATKNAILMSCDAI